MKLFTLLTLLFGSACMPKTAPPTALDSAQAFAYPQTPTVDQVDDYFGTEVADPYRWLEDLDSDETAAWVEAQNKLTFGYLESIDGRKAIAERLAELWDYPRRSIPTEQGGRLFYTRNSGLQNQSMLVVEDEPGAKARVLIDPNAWSEDGTVAMSGWWPSQDGKLLAYGVSEAGSDWLSMQVLDVTTGEPLADRIEWVKFSGASWLPDGSGFYYSAYDAPAEGEDAMEDTNLNQKLFFHKLGDEQSADVLVLQEPDHPEWGFSAGVTEDGHYLVVHVWNGTAPENALWIQDLSTADSPIQRIRNAFDATWTWVGNDDSTAYLFTTLNAPRGRLLRVDLTSPETMEEILPQREATLESVSLVGDMFFARYLEDAHSLVLARSIDGTREAEVPLPGLGSAYGFGGHRSSTATYYSYQSFIQPTVIYRLDLQEGQPQAWYTTETPFDPSPYTVEQAFVPSTDGVKVPVFVIHKKNLERSGDLPTLLYGYGGFNISITPYYSSARAVWLEMGGVLVVANLRGGGEYGEEWHQGGILCNKQNVFDDFANVARWLVEQKITDRDHLAIQGRSNGGLLVGASITQHPELFGAALPGVGVLDMLRFHTFTIGWAWASDYGSSEDAEQFQCLYAYSPYHRVQAGDRFPATLITTSDHDDRVVPSHSFKFAAAMQAAQAGPDPVLIRIETRAGHGAGLPTSKRIQAIADEWAFLLRNLEFQLPEGFGSSKLQP